MTKTEQRQAAKGKAFNRIKKLYHPKSDWKPFEYPRDESYSEKKEYEVKTIMNEYFMELDLINKKSSKCQKS